jgi:large subunit ribosomal protein L18
MDSASKRRLARQKKQRRLRNRIKGSPERPRLSVFRSAKHIYAQIIDDVGGCTLASASTCDKEAKGNASFESKIAAAEFVGKVVAERALKKGVSTVVFDRNGFLYHGRVKAVSDGAREGGLKF